MGQEGRERRRRIRAAAAGREEGLPPRGVPAARGGARGLRARWEQRGACSARRCGPWAGAAWRGRVRAAGPRLPQAAMAGITHGLLPPGEPLGDVLDAHGLGSGEPRVQTCAQA
jgi:hypothetical protein